MGTAKTNGTATVTAWGDAVVPGTPDEGIWDVEIDALDASADGALVDVARRSTELGTLLDELGVPPQRHAGELSVGA